MYPSVFSRLLLFGRRCGKPTARGFEPLRAEPNGFLVHHLNHSVTLSWRKYGARPFLVCIVPLCLWMLVVLVAWLVLPTGIWRNGSASDSRSEGWEFESLCPHCLRVRRVVGVCVFRANVLPASLRRPLCRPCRCQEASCGIRTHDLPLTERVLCQLS